MEIIILEQDDKTKIEEYSCVTCMWAGHKGNQFPRPTCIKIFDYNGNCIQVCEECIEKIYKEYHDVKKRNIKRRRDYFEGVKE